MPRTGLLVAILMFALPAAAEVYQWRDAQGRVIFSDTPPPDGPAPVIKGPARKPAQAPVDEESPATSTPANTDKTRVAPAAAGKPEAEKADGTTPKTIAEKELGFRQRRAAAAEAEAKAEKERQQTAERARNCEQARNQITGLASGQRVARYNSDGQREVLDDGMRNAEIERAQKYIDANCR